MLDRICQVPLGNLQCVQARILVLLVNFALIAAEAIFQKSNLIVPVVYAHLDAVWDKRVVLVLIRQLQVFQEVWGIRTYFA